MWKGKKYSSITQINEDWRLDMQEFDLMTALFNRYGEFTILPGNNIYTDIPLEQEWDEKILGILYHIHSLDDTK